MSYFLYIYCRSQSPINRQEITEFIEEGVYFDEDPRYEPPAQFGENQGDNWDSFNLYYQDNKNPVTFYRNAQAESLRYEIEVAVDDVEMSGKTSKEQSLIRHLEACQQLIKVEIDRSDLTEDAWDLINNLERYLAKEYGGVVYAPDDGFYDHNLRLILSLEK
jgi:hypothetical protein